MRALITGASSGIGKAVARYLAAPGVSLALSGSRESEKLDAAVAHVRERGGNAIALAGDLADPDTPARLVAMAISALGGLDCVIANAGVSMPAPLAILSLEDWDRTFAINTRSTWLLAKAAYAPLCVSKGSMVLVASMAGVAPYGSMGAYSPSKAALIMLARTLAQEWAADGIRVNSVSPGLIETPLTAPIYRDPSLREQRAQFVPAGRIGDPEADVAGVIAFLASDAAQYMTGQNLTVDGGLLDSLQSRLPGRPASDL